MRTLVVRQGGARTTVEDLGRHGVAHLGVPAGGAFDPIALAAANLLLGNPAGAAGLELTLKGPELENACGEDLRVAMVGADFAVVVVDGRRETPLVRDRAVALPRGAILRSGYATRGSRAWLAVAGGIQVPPILGSLSTNLAGGFGGLAGRALRAGDPLPIGSPSAGPGLASWTDPDREEIEASPVTLRLLPGPELDRFAPRALARLADTLWIVAGDSNRTGVRLHPADQSFSLGLRGVDGIPPAGTTLGAIQVPPDGLPIILGPDRPTTGGYAKPALVIAADLGRLARLRPGDEVRFRETTLTEALDLLGRRHRALGGGEA
jgi:biotin-dependent carboxylase-like uncharacterized protein